MQIQILAMLTGATLSLATPASYSVQIEIVDSPPTTNSQETIQVHNVPHISDDPEPQPDVAFPFTLMDLATRKPVGVDSVTQNAPLSLIGQNGDPAVFTLRNGILAIRDPLDDESDSLDDEGSYRYQVGINAAKTWPPLTALLPLSDPAPGTPLQFVAASKSGGYVIQLGPDSQKFGGFSGGYNGQGQPIVFFPNGNNPSPLALQIQ